MRFSFRTALSIVILLAAGMIAGAAAAYHHYKPMARGHVEPRTKAILSQATQRDFPVVVLGDSIVELADIEGMCGAPTLNAGIAGANLAQVGALADALLPHVHPRLIVVAAGVNDSVAGGGTAPADFAAHYAALVQAARGTGARVVAATIAPVGAPGTVGGDTFDPARIAALNTRIAAAGVPVIDLGPAMRAPGASHMAAAYSDDGVHPNAAGYRRWTAAIDTACRIAA